MSPQTSGHYHYAGGITIESMNETTARKCRKLRETIQNRIGKRSIRIASARMNDQTYRLIDDDDIKILIKHL